jgi:glycosyltransferase involved in cell wall biosynthesis
MTSARPRVAIDAHTIGRRATGNETYVRGLLSGLVERSDVEPIALIDSGTQPPDWLSGHTAELRRRSAAPRLLLELATAGRRWAAELLHVQYVRPPVSDVACVTTIHDISFEHFPALFTPRTRARMRLTIPWSARHSRIVLTGSRHAREDLLATYRLPDERVAVTPYAADARFRPLPADEVGRRVDRFSLPPSYLLCVGNLQPRKNLRRLLEAYARLPQDVRPPLVVVGQAAWLYDDVYAAVREHGLSASVHFTGFVETDELVGLYNAAAAFAYPSLFEGFGLPVLEALACGVPTLTSSRSSLPEVAGDAALLVDPESVDEIAAGLQRILCDTDLRSGFVSAGPAQAARFSWPRCAELTVEAYHRALA